MINRPLLCALGVVLFLLAGEAGAAPQAEKGLVWQKDLAAARAEATKAGKPMLIVIEDGT